MNRITISILVVTLGLMVGCGTAGKTIIAKSQSERADVFQEISATEAIPAGYADLMIRASIKTHVEGYYAKSQRNRRMAKNSIHFWSTSTARQFFGRSRARSMSFLYMWTG